MRRLCKEILDLIKDEYEVYADIYFNELNKGIMLFHHLEGDAEEISNTENQELSILQDMVKKKESLIENLRNETTIHNKPLSYIFEKTDSELYKEFIDIREKFAILLNATNDINSKNMMLLNTSAMVVKRIFENIAGKSETYDTNGNRNNNNSGRIIAQI